MKTEGSAPDGARVARLCEASDWLLRLEGANGSDQEIDAWIRWCDADPRNVGAFESLARDWRDLDALKADPAARATIGKLPTRTRQRSPYLWTAAACVVIVAITAAWLLTWNRAERGAAGAQASQVAAATTNRSATLPDGSKVILGAATSVRVDFSGGSRRLDLSRGEAYFRVWHDKLHPFVVHAGGVSVKAVGTAFDVRRDASQIVVTVEEGAVEVTDEPSIAHPSPTPWRVEAGYQLKYSSPGRVATIASVEPAKLLSWRDGELAYVWEPLGSVIDDLNRHASRRIVIRDPQVAELRFSGTVFTASVDDWLQAVQQAYPVRVEAGQGGEVVLSARH